MSLTSALNSALSGLRTTQSSLAVVADNIANADTPGHTRKNAVLSPNITGDASVGVRVEAVIRELDIYLQRQLRTEAAGAAYTSTRASYLDQLQTLFGQPGSEAAFDAVVNSFSSALDQLVASPDSVSVQSQTIAEAQVLARTLNLLSQDVQSLRAQADAGLQDATERANVALQGLEKIQRDIAASTASGVPSAALLDQRDRLIGELSQMMDIRVVESGNDISVFTNSGVTLFDGQAARLRFDSQPAIGPEALYSSDPAERTIGTIVLETPGGSSFDLLSPGGVRSGEIFALAELRNVSLVQAQNQLDEFAAQLADAFSGTTVIGEEATPGAGDFAVDVAGLQPGNSITLSYTDGAGDTQTVTLVRVDDPSLLPLANNQTANPNDTVVGIDFSGGLAAAVADIQAALGGNFTVGSTGTELEITGDGVNATVTSLNARVTITDPQSGQPAFALFVDAGAGSAPYTGSLEGVPQRQGLAGRIGVNPQLLQNPDLLVKFDATTNAGDPTRPEFLRDALELRGRLFAADTGIGGVNAPFTGSITDFARQIVETQGRNADLARRLDEGQQVVVNALRDRFQEQSGVDVDDELSKLLQLQTSYAANARVVSAVRELLDRLLAA